MKKSEIIVIIALIFITGLFLLVALGNGSGFTDFLTGKVTLEDLDNKEIYGIIASLNTSEAIENLGFTPGQHAIITSEFIGSLGFFNDSSLLSVNNSFYWDGNAWNNSRWLNINGSNANQEINIGSEDFSTIGDISATNIDLNGNITGILSIIYNISGCDGEEHEAGHSCYDFDADTLSLTTQSGQVIQVGREVSERGINRNGDLEDGAVVYLSGASGDNPEFKRADGSNVSESFMIGILTTDCLANELCPITNFGFVNNLNTLSFHVGDKLYINASSPGELTNIIPTLPNNPLWVATVIRSHSTQGRIFVNPTIDPSDGFLINSIYVTSNITIEGAIKQNGYEIDSLSSNSFIDDDILAFIFNRSGDKLPIVGFQSGGSNQASYVASSFMIVNRNATILNTENKTDCIAQADSHNITLKIDCNTTDINNPLGTGPDFLGFGDIQIVGEGWFRDTQKEWHFLSRELSLGDEMRDKTLTSKVNSSLIGTNLTIQEHNGEDIVVNIDEKTLILNKNIDSILITEGTNSSPTFNHVYYNGGGAIPELQKSSTPQSGKADVAQILAGEGIIYGSIVGSATSSELISGIYNRFFDEGAIYKSGFDINVSSTEINLSTGVMKVLLSNFDIDNPHSTLNLSVEIHNDGSFHQHINALNDYDEYSTGEAISNNRYFNLVCGIATRDSEGIMYCVGQNKPSNEHTSSLSAETDNSFVNFFPNDEFIKKIYTPVVRVVVKRQGGVNTIQTLSSEEMFLDLRGQVSGGGAPPTPGITSHKDLSELEWNESLHTFNNAGKIMDIGSYNFTTSNGINASIFTLNGSGITDWSQVNITGASGIWDNISGVATYEGDANITEDLQAERIGINTPADSNYWLNMKDDNAKGLFAINVQVKQNNSIYAPLNFKNTLITTTGNPTALIVNGEAIFGTDLSGVQTIYGSKMKIGSGGTVAQTQGTRNLVGIRLETPQQTTQGGTSNQIGVDISMGGNIAYLGGSPIANMYGAKIVGADNPLITGGTSNRYGLYIEGFDFNPSYDTTALAIWVNGGDTLLGGDLNVTGDYIHNGDTGFTGDCVNMTYSGGIGVSCND